MNTEELGQSLCPHSRRQSLEPKIRIFIVEVDADGSFSILGGSVLLKHKWATKKIRPYFPLNPACLIGILISNGVLLITIALCSIIPYTPQKRLYVIFHCSNGAEKAHEEITEWRRNPRNMYRKPARWAQKPVCKLGWNNRYKWPKINGQLGWKNDPT